MAPAGREASGERAELELLIGSSGACQAAAAEFHVPGRSLVGESEVGFAER